MAVDILLGNDNDLNISGGDFVMGESTIQEVGIILRLNPGELKFDPILGPGLPRMLKAPVSRRHIQDIVKIHLLRDGKQYDDIKNQILINQQSI